MNDKRKEYTFLWLIESYSYCGHKNGEVIESPVFITDGLEGTAWNLSLYPRGKRYTDKGYISLFLRRGRDNGPINILLEFELSIIGYDGSVLNQSVNKYSFSTSTGRGSTKIAQFNEVLLRRKEDYLPQDTLKVLCKIWKADGSFEQAKQIVARTRIGIERISFLHVIENFSAIEPNSKNIKVISSPSKNGLAFLGGLYYSDDSLSEGKMMVEITTSKYEHILAKCKVSLIEKFGKEIECVETDYRYDTRRGRETQQKLHLPISRQNILSRRSFYLPDDKLSLKYECIFLTGIESEKIERSIHGLPKLTFKQICDNDVNNVSCNDSVKLNPSVLDEFKSFYNQQLLTDIEVKTKTKCFSAHKLVLGARSSVFQAMLTNDMREKNTDCIQIDDLDDNTVQQLLLFLYSNELENLQWESAIKLYYAGDKYAIKKLKVMCSSFLMNNITTSTAGELLFLADTHNDADFKKSVEDFIFKHEEEVFGSEEWINLIEMNSVLVSKTMCLKYKRKGSDEPQFWNPKIQKTQNP